jgi:TIR domain/Tetratricopeptide repeat
MAFPVFISYARSTSRKYAKALYHALEGTNAAAFLDDPLIEFGDEFPQVLVDALFGSRVVVIFADDAYFESWYCKWELRAILEPFVAQALDSSEEATQGALTHIVWARPPVGRTPEQHLPPLLEVRHWPSAEETAELKKLVEQRLEASTLSLAERLRAVARLDSMREVLHRRVLLKKEQPHAHAPCFPRNLPISRGDAFIGREKELWLIDFLLSDSGGAPVALEGGPGMGKSQLALEYFHGVRPARFPGGRFWVGADVSSDALILQWYGILRELRPDAPDLEVLQRGDVRANLESLLGRAFSEAAESGPILFVVDNLPEPSPGEPVLPLSTWCPVPGLVALLVTSRYRYSVSNVSVHPLPVGALGPKAAVELLTFRLELAGIRRTELDDEQWRHISMRVGYLPLALDLLRGAMAARRLSLAELLERIEAASPPAGGASSALGAVAPDVFKAFEISYNCLPDEAKRMARVLARLAPEPIPERLWKAFGPEMASGEVRSALVMHSFISPGGGDGSVRMLGGMHRLLAEFLCGCSTGQEAAEEEERVYRALESVFDGPVADPKERAEKDACVTHAEWLVLRTDASGWVGETSAFWAFAGSFNVFLFDRGFWPQARVVGERILVAANGIFSGSHPVTLSAMGNLAVTLKALGEAREARRLEEEVLEGRREVLGARHPDTLSAMGNLAVTLVALGHWDKARALLEAALAQMRIVLGESHPDTCRAQANLDAMSQIPAFIAQQGGGDCEDARLLWKERSRTQGRSHPETLSAARNLACKLKERGQLHEARLLLEEVLECKRARLGDTHPEVLAAMGELADACQSLGLISQSRELRDTIRASCPPVRPSPGKSTRISLRAWLFVVACAALVTYLIARFA